MESMGMDRKMSKTLHVIHSFMLTLFLFFLNLIYKYVLRSQKCFVPTSEELIYG